MSRMVFRMPDSLHDEVRKLAKKEGCSINLFVLLAVTEKVAAMGTVEYLEAEGEKRGTTVYEEILRRREQRG